ncbi:ER retention sequence binding [Fragilaria crotonensis]|nr:ER retention sequence binding [Fragilaria crotonensis]
MWEPLSLIPQAVLYRRYRQVEGLMGASFLFLMGLYRLLYVAYWIVRTDTGDLYAHDLLIYLGGGAQVLIASCALFWPDRTNEGDLLAAPILNQIIVFCRELYCGMISLLLLFGLIFYNESNVFHGFSAVLVRFVLFTGYALLILTPPACFLHLYCENTRTSADVGRDDSDDFLDDLTLPLVGPTRNGVASDDPMILNTRSLLLAETKSDTEYDAPSTSPNDADGIATAS